MSSWGLGNTIFEITIFTWVFKYEVQKLSFLKLPYSREFLFQKLTNISYKRSLLTILFQKPASIWVLVEGFNFWPSNHNVPSGSSAYPYDEARSVEFDGTGWMDGDQKCPLKFNFKQQIRFLKSFTNFVLSMISVNFWNQIFENSREYGNFENSVTPTPTWHQILKPIRMLAAIFYYMYK